MQLQETLERRNSHENSLRSEEALLHDFLASFIIVFIVAAKRLRKACPKGHKRQEQLLQQPLGNPQRPKQQQHTVVSILACIIAVIMFFVVGSSTSPIRSPKQKGCKKGRGEKRDGRVRAS